MAWDLVIYGLAILACVVAGLELAAAGLIVGGIIYGMGQQRAIPREPASDRS